MSVNVFSTKVLIEVTIFMSPTWRRNRHFTWSPAEPCEDQAVCMLSKGSTFISLLFLRPWVLVRPQESNPPPPDLPSSANWANPAMVKDKIHCIPPEILKDLSQLSQAHLILIFSLVINL